ncbi:MAG: hypothetical protein ACOYOL_03725 [Chthoniobacterales bacterium]
MPRLPSGRSAAINYESLSNLLKRATDTHDAGLLLFLENEREIFRWLDVIQVEWPVNIPAEELDRIDTPEGLRYGISTPTGFSVSDVLAARVPWSLRDIAAFKRFIRTSRVSREIAAVGRDVVQRRAWLTDRAIMWPHPALLLPR